MLDANRIKPLPGNMIVRREALYKNTGLIAIPERYQRTPSIIGVVVAVTLSDADRRTLGAEIQAGARVILADHGGRYIAGNVWAYPVSFDRRDTAGHKYRDSAILAICDATVELAPHTEEIERCRWCGDAHPNAKGQNVILWQDRCPRCGRDRHGEQESQTSPKLTARAQAALMPVAS